MTAINFLTDAEHRHPALSLEELSARHLLVVGQTGSGKTTTTLALLDSLQPTPTTAIVLDPTGEYRSLPNSQHYVFGENCFLDAGAWDADQLLTALNIVHDERQTALVARAIQSLRIASNLHRHRGTYRKLQRSAAAFAADARRLGSWARSYPVDLLADQLIEEIVVPYADSRADYSLLGQQYDRQLINRQWQFVATIRQRLASTTFRDLFDTRRHPGKVSYELRFVLQLYLTKQAHKTLVIDLSQLREVGSIQRALISLILNTMLVIRSQADEGTSFPVEVVIDEAHRYLPTDPGQLADNGIFRLLREGRKAGLSLTITTQSTLDLPDRLRSQFAAVLVHHLASVAELAYLHQSDLPTTNLPVGRAFLIHGSDPVKEWRISAPGWLEA